MTKRKPTPHAWEVAEHATLSVIQDIAILTAAGLGVEQVVDGVYNAVSRLMDTTNFYIALYDEIKQEIFFCIDVTEGQRVDRGADVRRAFGQGLTEYIITSRAPLLLEAHIEETCAQLGIELKGKVGAVSWLGIPLMIGERVIGVMTVQSYTTPGMYGERERDLLMIVANLAAAALENARLATEQARRFQEMIVLDEIGQSLAATRSLEEVFQTAHAQLSRLFDASNFYIALVDEARGVWMTSYDIENDKRLPVYTYPLDKGLTGHIVAQRRSLLFRSAAELQAYTAQLDVRYVGGIANSWLGTPLFVLNHIVGVLALESYSDAFLFTEHDQALIQAFAIPVANAIYNAQLFERLQQQALQEQHARTITESILAAADTEAVLRIAAEELGLLLGATKAIVRLGTREQLLSAAQAADFAE